MKLMISGSRGITEFDFEGHIENDVDTVICGGAKGVDTLAMEYAHKKGLKLIVLRPDYERYGKAAPLIRNREMVDMADIILAVWDSKSKGTKYTINYATKQHKSIRIFTA